MPKIYYFSANQEMHPENAFFTLTLLFLSESAFFFIYLLSDRKTGRRFARGDMRRENGVIANINGAFFEIRYNLFVSDLQKNNSAIIRAAALPIVWFNPVFIILFFNPIQAALRRRTSA